MHRLKRSVKSSHHAVERQASVEYLDSLSYQDDTEREKYNSSTSDLMDTPAKKVKKKRHFRGVFGHRHKDKSALDGRLGESLPARSSPLLNLTADTTSHLSLDNSWSHSNWKSLDPDKNSSTHSSNVSLLSVESELKELTDDELVESLVHPQGKDSFQASVSVSAIIRHAL